MATEFETVRDAILAVMEGIATIGDHADRPSVAKFAAMRVLEAQAEARKPKSSDAADLLDSLADAIENVAGMLLPPVACQSLAVVTVSTMLKGSWLIDGGKIRKVVETDFQDSTDDGEAWIVYTKREPVEDD